MRVWFSGRMAASQAVDGSSILPTRTFLKTYFCVFKNVRVSPKLLWGAGESKDFSLSSPRDGKVPGDVVADSLFCLVAPVVQWIEQPRPKG